MVSKRVLVKQIEVGDRVQYSAMFLRSSGIYCGDTCFIVGTVVSDSGRIAYVKWDGDYEDGIAHINKANLINAKYKAYERVD
jgi:hypothetical protein